MVSIQGLSRWGAWLSLRAFAGRIVARDLAASFDGLHNVPESGSVILASRHVHHLYDGCLLLSAIPRPLHLLVAHDWARSAIVSRLLRHACSIAGWPSVTRFKSVSERIAEGGDCLGELRQALTLTAQTAKEGHALLIFPEAYPIIDPRPSQRPRGAAMAPFARGAADLAWYAQRHIGRATPIVPVGLEYAEREAHVTTGRWPVSVRFGSPVLVDNAGCRAPITRMLERQIASLSGLGDVLQPIAGEPFR